MEQDRFGIDQHAPGAKLDLGKVMAGRLLGLFSNALESVAEVGTYGAEKYSEGGWQEVPDDIKRYEDAQFRHWMKRHQGEERDKETDFLHAAHEDWNCLAKLELMIRDNRNNASSSKREAVA